jgi:hypothetical protein
MAIKPLNSVNGFSVGDIGNVVVYANLDIVGNTITADNDLVGNGLVVNGISQLSDISNVKITGGTAGQSITTDGNGNLTFSANFGNSAAVMPYYIPPGQSYIVETNFQGLFTLPIEIDGELEVDGVLIDTRTGSNSISTQVLFDNGGEVTGNAGFNFDMVTGNLTIPGNAQFGGNLLPGANVTYNLGAPFQQWNDLYLAGNTIYLGTSTISTDGSLLLFTNGSGGQLEVSGDASVTTIQNGNSNVSINANGNVVTSVSGNAGVFVVSSTGSNIYGTLSVSGNATVGGILTDNLYRANGQLWNPAITAGSNTQIQYNNNGNLGASNKLTFDDASAVFTMLGNIVATGVKTSNLYYANGNPWDLQQPAGSNTQLQFNNDDNFGASANLTFNTATNQFTVNGNSQFNNVVAGNVISANYLVSNSGCVVIGNGTIAVSGTSAGIFNSSVTDINIGLVSNITLGSTTGSVTVRNNLDVTNVLDAPSITVGDLYSRRTSIPIIGTTIVDTFPASYFRTAKYTMRIANDAGYQAVEVLLVHDDINSIMTVYGSLSTTGNDLVTLTTGLIAGNVELRAAAISANTSVNLLGTYVPD